MFRAVLLDLDDTLYDRSAAFAAWAEAAARAQLGRSLEPREFAALCEMDRRGHRARARFAAEALLLGLVVDPERFPFELAAHVTPEPGVRETIAALVETRRVAIVTNGGPAQRDKLARIGLAGVVEAVFVSHEVGVAKPDPAIFERALRWTEQPAAHALFVGDAPAIDLAPAAALGMATAWRARSALPTAPVSLALASLASGEPWPAELPPPTYRIASIPELREVCG